MKFLIVTLAVVFSGSAFAETGPTPATNINCKDVARQALEANQANAPQTATPAATPEVAPAN